MVRKLRYLFIVVLVVVLFSNTVSASTIKSFSMTYTVDQQEARDMLPLINEWRQSGDAWYWKSDDTTKYNCGTLSAYTYDYNLEQIALQRAYEIAVHFAHSRPDGSDCFTCTYNGTRSWGENIAAGRNTASATFAQWQENDKMYAGQGHRRAMLSTRYTAIGIGHVVYNGIHYWVQEFGEVNSGAAATTAITGTRTGTVSLNVDSATFKLDTDSYIHSVAYGISMDLPQIRGRYSTYYTWGSGGVIVPNSDLTNVKWTSSDPSKLVIQNNTTMKAVGAGSCTLTYSATYEGKSYSGTMNVSVSTVPLVSSDVTATIDTCSYEVNGVSPKPVIKYNGQTLVEGTDYEIQSYGNTTRVTEQAYACVKGLGNFTGIRYIYFEIVRTPLSDCTLSPIPNAYYTGNAVTPAVTLTYKGAELRKGTHYKLSCTDTDIGTATVTITGLTGFEGTLTSTFKIVRQTASNLTVDAIDDQQFTGGEILPRIKIWNGNRYLTNGTDYDVTFSNNIEPGTASAKFTFKGNYTGTKTVSFKIVPRQMTNVYGSGINYPTYTGYPLTQPNLTLSCGSYTLVEGTDYTIAYSNNVNVGRATVTLTGMGSYVTGTSTITFEIKPVNTTLTTFTLNDTCTYTGSAVIPDFTLTYGNLTFVEGTDFTVEYFNNVESGQAKAVITGISTILSGTANKYFMINPKSIETLTCASIPNQVYTGSAIKPAVTVKDGSVTLVKDTDYTVSYSNNVNVGTATVTVKGKGNYSGTKYATFKIVSASNPDPDPEPGVLTYAWKKVSGKWYLYDNYGRKVTGFAKVKDTWYYMNASGVMMTGWQKVDGVWYYFASSGAMKTGWQQISKVWYYFNSDGQMVTGFQQIGGVWYYFASSGAMKTGWQQVDGVWYYFASSGAMKTGWQQISKVWYYFDAEGKMLTGFQEIGGSMYYLKSSGAMATKWLKIDGEWYWFGTGGAMARSTSVKIDGKTYNFDADGVCLNP